MLNILKRILCVGLLKDLSCKQGNNFMEALKAGWCKSHYNLLVNLSFRVQPLILYHQRGTGRVLQTHYVVPFSDSPYLRHQEELNTTYSILHWLKSFSLQPTYLFNSFY